MKYFLPTYEEAREICDAYDNFQFYETVMYVDGYKVSCFNYRMVGINDFLQPLPDRPEVNGLELRGLCVVFNTDGTVFKRYILMNKFFNLNENPGTQLEILKHIPIKSVEDKLDGSIITFIELPNGKVYAKSKMVLDSDQSIAAQELYENTPVLQAFVQAALRYNFIPIFEYVSPKNRIVLKYNSSELILLKIRDNNTGQYLNDVLAFDINGINVPKILDYKTWEEILPLRDTVVDTEGWIITLENGMMLKYKTSWYCDQHKFIDNLGQENNIIVYILDEKIDDIISQIICNEDKIVEIESIKKIVMEYLKKSVILINLLISEYNGNKKEFAMKYSKNKYFPIAIKSIDGFDMLSLLKDKLRKYCYKLTNARSFILNCDI